MKQPNLLKRIKGYLAGKFFKAFIWCSDTTEEDYWEDIYFQEKWHRDLNLNAVED